MSSSKPVLAGIDWDCGRIPYDYTNPSYVIPLYFLVRVKDYESNPSLILIKSTFVTRTDHNGPPSTKFWKFSVVDNVHLLLSGAKWYEDGTFIPESNYYVERDATEARPLSIYSTKVKRTRNYMIIPELAYSSQPVYEYIFTHPLNVFPPKFVHVYRDKDTNQNYHFKGGVNMETYKALLPLPVVPVVPVTPSLPPSPPKQITPRIPTFVFHAYVTGAIEKNECCPVTLEPLSKEMVGCAPCGHLFDKDALRTALETNGKCPTCRQTANPDDIQTW